jgi:excisionase family DNA binding protein
MAEQLLLKPAEAARALAISQRMLRYLTTRGEITPVRIGRAIRYQIADLQAWIEHQKTSASCSAPTETEVCSTASKGA